MKVETLIVGLGNPGAKYEKTRHNIGFMVLDKLGSGFTYEKRFNAEVCDFLYCHSHKNKNLDSGQASMTKGATVLMKPQTYMNSSGKAVKAFADYYKVDPENIWVIHDDIDIPFGEIRIREKGSSAGHKGIESMIKHLGTSDFLRFKVGIKSEIAETDKIDTEDFVLQRFSENENEKLPKVINICINEIEEMLETSNIEPKTLKIEKS